MSITVFTKVIFVAATFALDKYFGFVIISTIVILRLAITKMFWKNLSFENSFLGALTSITAPCLLLKENSNHYWISNYLDTVLSLLVVGATYIIARFDTSQITSYLMKNTIFQCTVPSINGWNVTQISRCSNDSTIQSCYPGLFPICGNSSFTACPSASDEWLPLFYLSLILTGLQVISIFSILIMNYCSDSLKRFKVSLLLNKCCKFPILWKEKNKDWQANVEDYLQGKLSNNEEKLLNLLKSAITSGGFLGLIKVMLLIETVPLSLHVILYFRCYFLRIKFTFLKKSITWLANKQISE